MAHPSGMHDRLALLDRYVRIQTLSGAVTHEHVAQVRAFWRGLGVELEPLFPEDGAGAPALFAEVDSGKPGPTVLLYGHYDVQPPGDLDRWRWGDTPCAPWLPRYFRNQQGEQEVRPAELADADLGGLLLVGRGGADNKGQHLANILGVLDARAAGTLRGRVKILLDGEEEHGSPHLAGIVTQNRGRLAADLLVGSDGPKPGGEPTIVLGVRGLLGVEITVDNGRGESVHSGNYSNVVESPVLPLARLLAALPERVNAVAQRHGGFRESVLSAFGQAGNRADWEGFLRPNTNVNGLLTEGMIVGKNRTIIPGWALAKIDVRLTPDTPPDEVFAAIEQARQEEAARSPGVTIAVRRTSLAPASYTAPGSAAFKAIVGASLDFWDREPNVVPLLGGTLPAFAFTELLGLPAYWLPGAQPNNRQHDVNEHLLLEHFFRQSGWYAAVLTALGDGR